MAIDPTDPTIVAILGRLDAAEGRVTQLESDVADLKQTARAKLREHLKDHIDAGYDFRGYIVSR